MLAFLLKEPENEGEETGVVRKWQVQGSESEKYSLKEHLERLGQVEVESVPAEERQLDYFPPGRYLESAAEHSLGGFVTWRELVAVAFRMRRLKERWGWRHQKKGKGVFVVIPAYG